MKKLVSYDSDLLLLNAQLQKNLHCLGNTLSGNVLELRVLTLLHYVPWVLLSEKIVKIKLVKMVQETVSKSNMNAYSAINRKDSGFVVDPAGRKSSQSSFKQQDSSKNYSSSQKTDSNAQKYGSWGPVYKNKDHFASMHMF